MELIHQPLSPRPLLAAVLLCGAVLGLRAQAPIPSPGPATELEAHGAALLEREDPVAARAAFLQLLAVDPDSVTGRLGLGQVHLMLGDGEAAVGRALSLLADDSLHQDAMALFVRSTIRCRRFHEAVRSAESFVDRVQAAGGTPGASLLAAQASALFRVQRNDEAAALYRRVLQFDPRHGEAHLRLGSGLTPPRAAATTPALQRAAAALGHGARAAAVEALQVVLDDDPGHPVAHRLLGEALFVEKAATTMAAEDPAFVELRDLLPTPALDDVPVEEFIPAYADLSAERQVVVRRSLALFSSRLRKLVVLGGRHDLLGALERTTDAPSRVRLRGTRTFDGRVWDDVRGIGGLQAATGIEALDEASLMGFDTLTHEVAHQVHFYALPHLERIRIRNYYQRAKREGLFLDYYAATNEAEYFGQGVEAFSALAKRPGSEPTHGHTRFELLRRDPRLHDLIASLVDYDVLRAPGLREQLLAAAAKVALRCGRLEDAETAVGLMAPGPRRDAVAAALRP